MKIELSENKVFFENDGLKKEIHPFWLRERVNGDQYVDQGTQQRLFDPTELKNDVKINKLSILDDFLEELLNNLNNARLNYQKSGDKKIYLTETKNITGNAVSDDELLKFAKLEKIDLEAAAIANAEGIERAVNAGTVNAGRCFELLSGAELNEKERTAKNDIAFNKECPWLYDTYKSRGLLDETPAD